MVYFISDLKNIKIGYTKGKPENRLKQLNTGSSYQLFLLGYIDGTKNKEKELHKFFNKYRIRQNGEWFIPAKELIEYINENNLLENNFVELDENDRIQIYFRIKQK